MVNFLDVINYFVKIFFFQNCLFFFLKTYLVAIAWEPVYFVAC